MADWELTDHCCRVCFSRVLRRAIVQTIGDYEYRCSGCGVTGDGSHPRAICSCGLKLKNGKDMGVRCVKNDAVTPECPFEIVARQVVSGR